MSFHVPNEFRIRGGVMGSEDAFGLHGAFEFFHPNTRTTLRAIASDGMGWEHVSVSLANRCPNWLEMCYAKSLFWDKEDCVIQYHPRESQYVNNHPYVLHLWRPAKKKIPEPPAILVGVK